MSSSIDQTQRELKERITKGLNHGIEALEEVLDATTDLFNQFVLLKSKYNDLMHFSAINVMPYNELELGFDRLRNSLIQLVDQLDEEELKKAHVEKEIENTAQPMLRANFFQLMEIHYRNLEAIVYEESMYNSETKRYDTTRNHGREAIFKIYASLRRRYGSKEEDTPEFLKKYFTEYFTHEIGLFEVYLNNVKHMLAYVESMEVDRPFFVTTLKSALSRFELAFLFYYAITELDSEFNRRCKDLKLFGDQMERTLFQPSHQDWLN